MGSIVRVRLTFREWLPNFAIQDQERLRRGITAARAPHSRTRTEAERVLRSIKDGTHSGRTVFGVAGEF
ncbi:hypothetical protein [Nocardia cyriacigeorgica]|uniref:hypothetical protein n=1 Tax=Nocardia cyriacigeorgica TaxID=135487 RepID=UPI002455A295|nr:hypothetical protein [Nocardia cyriacigeorgica]